MSAPAEHGDADGAALATDFDLRVLLGGNDRSAEPRWAKVVDHTRCIGCHACTTACRSENDVPLSVTRTYVKSVDVGTFPQVRRAFQVTRCNQCEDAPCVAACPTAAMYRRPDGIVDFDKEACIGCTACIAACPDDAIFINPEDHTAEKCNFCAHRLDIGLEPACVVVCPVEAILVGDLDDPGSRVAEIVNRESVTVRRPEKGTRPRVFYRGAHQATLDPLAARRPEGGLFMWSEQYAGPGAVTGGRPEPHNTSAAAVLSYDVPHRRPWDWRVSLYTWTKGIAAGAYLVVLALALAGALDWQDDLWRWGAPLLGGAFLALTGAVLIWDLEHPRRFLYIFTRPQWRSWLVRGAYVIAGYSAVLATHFAASVAGFEAPQRWLAIAGAPLAGMTAVYTGYLFAQAKARDLWQDPLLVPHLLVQAALAGAAAALVAATALGSPTEELEWILVAAALAHLLMIAAQASTTHATTHAALASHELTRGRYGRWFWAGAVLVAAAAVTPLLGVAAAPLALAGLLAHEHAYVQAGQAVPLA